MLFSSSLRLGATVSRCNMAHRTCSALQIRALTTYKFNVAQKDLDLINATLPLVAEAGMDVTKHFYRRMFKAHPELLNIFNQTNQAVDGQPKKLLKTIAVAAQAALETGELPGEAVEGICHKHAALNITPDKYDIVGKHFLGTIEDLLTTDEAVLNAWASLYGDIAGALTHREKELTDEVARAPGGWLGRRPFVLDNKEKLSETITRFRFVPEDGGTVPVFKPGQYTTVWANVEASGPYDSYTEQPRHYTLAIPRDPGHVAKSLSISVKKQGLVSSILHGSEEGSKFDLSAPYGCFDLSGAEHLWLSEEDSPVVFISGGVGITPVLAMLENVYTTRAVTWLHASQNGRVHAYRDRLRTIASVRSSQLVRRVWYDEPDPEDGPPAGDSDDDVNMAKYHFHGLMDLSSGNKDLDLKLLHLENGTTQYYMCGPPGFMEFQKSNLMTLGVDESRIHYEGF